MTSSGYDMVDPELEDYRLALFGGTSRISGNSEDLYQCPVFNPDAPLQEGIRGLFSSLYGTGEVDFGSRPWEENGPTEEVYEGEQLAYDDDWYWPSCFSYCQRENLFSLADDIQEIGRGNNLGKMEDYDYFRGEEQHNNSISYHEDGENQSVCHYNPWGTYGGGAEPDGPGRQEHRLPYGYNLDDLRLFEGIFGYWPCLFREEPNANWSEEN